ncbi:hypothetical protein QYE76_051447 [Lolium multiflorum]|uniref:Retrotransposon gag domain-containing protein n=1 Tax=Lolium multiflorum TaxID=4521 RepID=A0AAD8STN9_LOLMU|nr:hypothetical protein QYE76_051447 [Lolium multiflorum]
MFPCPRINEVLPPVAPAVVISTTVAPTVGHGTSSLRAAARPYSPIRRPVASGRMIATGNFFHIQPSSYQPASSPLAHAWMVPVGTINLFVGLAGVSDPTERCPGQLPDPVAPGQLLTTTLPLTGEIYVEGESALEDDADSAAMASVAGSTATASVAGSITAASFGDSITPVSNPSDFEDDSVLPLFANDSESDSSRCHAVPAPHLRLHGGRRSSPLRRIPSPPHSLRPRPRSKHIGQPWRSKGKKELVERQKFRLEQDSVRAVSHYCNERNRLRMERIQAQGFPSARLNFDDPDGEVRVARVQNHDVPESKVDANGLPLHSSPADNVAAAQAALANLPETGDGAIFVQHAKALVAKALEQQHAATDSQGRLYSRSSASRAASSAVANRVVASVNNFPPPAPQATHSTNHRVEPRPPRAMVAANGQPIDARTHIVNDQEWRARNRANDRFADEAPRQSAFNRVGPTCFGPMIRGEPYPVGFKGPRDIEKYDTHIDPTVWIDSYTMAMGILGYSELLAARYLPLMMDGVNRHWFNTLTPNSIDSWEEARAAFIQHFASAYTRATTIEDLDRCVQGPRESTRRWVQRWQDMWTTSSGINTDTAIYCFRRCCRYEPLSAKLRRISRDNISIAELFDIAQRYADEDPIVDSDDEYGQQRNRRPTHSDTRRGDYQFGGRSSNGKRRADGGHTELVANADYEQRDPKSFRRDNRAQRRPAPAQMIEKARRAKEGNGGNQHKDRTKDQDQHKEDGFGRSAGSLHTFTGVGDRRDRKVLARAVAVNAVVIDVPRWLNWSEQSITWSREDHAPRIEYPGRVALVVRPKPDSRLENTKVTFHGIVPGRKAFPIGKVTLPVTFGTPVNYRTERITFEVVNFRSPYHCVLGRQAFASFMAAPHYAYNMMKMPGPRGIITVHGDPEMAVECEDNGAKLADAVIAEEHDNTVMSTHASFPVDSVGPPRAEVCRTAASFPLSGSPKVYRTQEEEVKDIPLMQPRNHKARSLLCPQHT